jgi:hypothetical protein
MYASWPRNAVLAGLFVATAAAAPPRTEEQRVWLAAARHVLANESAAATHPGPLSVHSRTSYPGFPASVAQLREAARNGLCDAPADDSAAILEQLEKLNAHQVSVREVFTGLPGFRVTDERPENGDYLGLSRVLISQDLQTAYLNLDISGLSGSIVQMKLENGEWRVMAECAQWASW